MTDQMTDERPTGEEHPKRTREGLFLPIAIPVIAVSAILLILFGFSRILLSLSHGAATAVALIVAVSIVTLASMVASRDRLTNGALFSMIGAVAGVAMLAGGIAILAIGKGGGEGGQSAKPQLVALAAPKGAAVTGYDQDSLSVIANVAITLEFDNQDPGIQHNVVIFAEDPAKNPQAAALFTGDLVTGPQKFAYDVPALKPGTYYFHCAVHPTTMIGTIAVGVGGGGGGITLTAQGVQFDTKELDLTAGQATTITFDNKDPGTAHNLAIYSDPQKTTTLFQGDQVVGPTTEPYHVPPLQPGTYYFQCDVHPTMNGTVVVSGGAGGSAAPPPPSASPS
jgi:plastocyanin